MADKWPLANGNWSNAANWNGGTKPVAGDVVYADGKTVTIDENATVATVTTATRSGGTAGGGFTLNAGIVLTANVTAGVATCVTYASAGLPPTIIGNMTGSTTTGSVYAATITGSGLNVVGNVSGGSQYSAYGIYISSTAQLTVLGNISGGSGNSSRGLHIAGSGLISITGSVLGGPAVSADGVYHAGTSTINIVGNVTGGQIGSGCIGITNVYGATINITGNVTGGEMVSSNYGLLNTSIGVVSITGNAIAGKASSAVYNAGSGTVTISGYAQANEHGPGSVGFLATPAVIALQNGIVVVNALKYGLRGMSPVSGPVYVPSFSSATCYVRKSDFTEGVLIDSASVNNPPAVTDVRSGVQYTTGGVLIGTLVVPAAGSVALGVAVDDTVGTAVLTAEGVRTAVGLASANLDDQFDAISIDPQSIRDAMKLAPSAGAAAANSIDSKVEDRATPAAVAALLAAALDAP